MNEKRKQIILSEIKYWKQNNLLPDHYCDFLTALYAKGDEQQKEESKITSSILHKEKKKNRMIVYALILASIFLVMVMQFLQHEFALLIGAAGIFMLLGYATVKSLKQSVVLPAIYIVSAFLLLFLTLKLWSLFFFHQPMILIGLLILNCVTWLFAGRLLRLMYFTLSGAIGLICIIGFLVLQF